MLEMLDDTIGHSKAPDVISTQYHLSFFNIDLVILNLFAIFFLHYVKVR